MKRIKIPLFDFKIALSVDRDECIAFVERECLGRHKETMLEALDDCEGIFLEVIHKDDVNMTRLVGVFDGKVSRAGHEGVHLANSVLSGAGVKTSDDNDEMVAYIVGWTIDQFEKVFKHGS